MQKADDDDDVHIEELKLRRYELSPETWAPDPLYFQDTAGYANMTHQMSEPLFWSVPGFGINATLSEMERSFVDIEPITGKGTELPDVPCLLSVVSVSCLLSLRALSAALCCSAHLNVSAPCALGPAGLLGGDRHCWERILRAYKTSPSHSETMCRN